MGEDGRALPRKGANCVVERKNIRAGGAGFGEPRSHALLVDLAIDAGGAAADGGDIICLRTGSLRWWSAFAANTLLADN